jgi:hypothetical protein
LRGYIILVERISLSFYVVHNEKPEKFNDVNFKKLIIKDALLSHYLELGFLTENTSKLSNKEFDITIVEVVNR